MFGEEKGRHHTCSEKYKGLLAHLDGQFLIVLEIGSESETHESSTRKDKAIPINALYLPCVVDLRSPFS